jgi:UDP-N-acetylglucosamine--N-acetylmuramyl-(pentapeptide) pyrophosphoryl-undecaprenol N-acetylglucosamine transferase
MTAGRLPVLASRSPEFGETPDGHQRQLGGELADRGLALHRPPDRITVDDLVTALHTGIRRVGDPAPFELAA